MRFRDTDPDGLTTGAPENSLTGHPAGDTGAVTFVPGWRSPAATRRPPVSPRAGGTCIEFLTGKKPMAAEAPELSKKTSG